MVKLVSDTIDKNDINKLIEWLSQDTVPQLTKGKLTIELEKKWAQKIGTKYSVYVNSGSSAILLSLAALLYLGRIKNKKIVVPSLSWATDVSSPMLLGMEPIMCDSNLKDLSCDLNHMEEIFKEHNPSALILVSTLGLVPNMDKILDLCKKYDVILFEDVCESMGSKYKGKYLGGFGFASFFSAYFGHHISTIEGGFINTSDEDFYHLLLMMRSHGWDRDLPEWKQKELRKKYDVDDFSALYNFYLPGFNLRSTDLQAFIGLMAVDKLDEYSKIRNKNFNLYLKNISNSKLKLEIRDEDYISNLAFPIVCDDKNEVIKRLIENNIEVRPLIAGDMSKKPMWYEQYGKLSLCNSEMVNEFGFYVPNHQDLTEDEIMKICKIINNE
jgi:CDP-6-deoxy-D-xylo-4-hexulose-3-dehydrase